MGLILAFIGIGIIIFVHEFGHFLLAKRAGVRVDAFVLGFGPKVASFQWGETTYGIALLPFGGYVKMPETADELAPAESHRAFSSRPGLSKLGVLLAGPLMNVFLAVFLFAGVFGLGVPVPTTVIDQVERGSGAAVAGIRPGDRILAIAGQPVSEWADVTRLVRANRGEPVKVTLLRNGERRTVQAKIGQTTVDGQTRPVLGIRSRLETRQFTAVEALSNGAQVTWRLVALIAGLPGMLITGSVSGEEFLEGSLGPVGVIHLSSQAASRGIADFLWLLGVISTTVGVLNLLPIPPLDGGRVAILGYETIRGAPISRERLVQLTTLGLALVLTLLVLLTVSDVSRILTGATLPGG